LLSFSAPAPCRSGCRGEAPWPPEATGAKRNSYIAKLKILPRSAEAELTDQVNSPVRPEGRTSALEQSQGTCFNAFSGTGEAPPSARAGELTSRSTPPLPLTAELVRHLSYLVSVSPSLRRPRRFANPQKGPTLRPRASGLLAISAKSFGALSGGPALRHSVRLRRTRACE